MQGRFISWAPERKPGLHANFTDRVLLAQRYTGTVPGYPAGLQVQSAGDRLYCMSVHILHGQRGACYMCRRLWKNAIKPPASTPVPLLPQGAQYEVRDPFMRPAGGVAGSEQPDIDAHAFAHCTLPLIWWPDP